MANDRDDDLGFQGEADEAIPEELKLEGKPEALAKFFAELAAAQLKFEGIAKDQEGQIGFQKFKYSNLASLRKATMPHLAAHGIAIIQPVFRNKVVTIVSGHGARIVWALDFGEPKNVKDMGKRQTYARRYAYQAALVLAGDEDLDQDAHNDGEMRPPPKNQQRKPSKPEPKPKPEPKTESKPETREPEPEPDFEPDVVIDPETGEVLDVASEAQNDRPLSEATRVLMQSCVRNCGISAGMMEKLIKPYTSKTLDELRTQATESEGEAIVEAIFTLCREAGLPEPDKGDLTGVKKNKLYDGQKGEFRKALEKRYGA